MTSSFGAYQRVFMLGIDGMGAFNKLADTPVMDELFRNGATTYTALAARPTISGQCWTSMLTGALPEVHGLSNANMHPIEGLPTIFGLLRQARPEAHSAAFTDWSPIAMEIISPTGGADVLDSAPDDELTDRLLTYLDDHDPTLLFIQFDSVDGAGHQTSYGSPEYLERIHHVDGLLGKLVEKYKERGFFDDTLFLVTADHGGTPHHTHGGWTRAEREVFLGVAGKTVLPGQIGEVSMRDFPAIVLWALGVEAPAFNPKGYASQMPMGVFEDCGIKNRVELFERRRTPDPKPEPEIGSPEHMDNFIDPSKVLMRISFEDQCEDVTGKCEVITERGFVKHYSTGLRGNCGEFGNGTLRVKGLPTPDVFSISLWYICSMETAGWIDLFSTLDGEHPGIVLRSSETGIGFHFMGADGERILHTEVDGETAERVEEPAWCHYLFVVDMNANTVTCRSNFGKPEILRPDFSIRDYVDLSRLRLGTKQKMPDIYHMVDDLMILDGEADMDALKRYYGIPGKE